MIVFYDYIQQSVVLFFYDLSNKHCDYVFFYDYIQQTECYYVIYDYMYIPQTQCDYVIYD